MKLKPGTRCECLDEEHETASHKRFGTPMAMLVWCQCKADAVRLVDDGRTFPDGDSYVPMCAACAEHHENKGA
jgi:hypothetical protein